MDSHRFFRSSADVYEQIRTQLDAAWGHGPGTGTLTCFDPIDEAPRDKNGKALLAVRAEFCQYEAVAAMLPTLLESGEVQEISREQYLAATPTPLP